MQKPRRSPWMKAIAWLILIPLLSLALEGQQVAQAYDRIRARSMRNEALVTQLGISPSLAREDILRRQAQARSVIKASRSELRSRQAEGLNRLRRVASSLEPLRQSATLRGLARTSDDLIESVRRITESPLDEKALRAEGLRLYFLRENLKSQMQLLERSGVLEKSFSSRASEVIRALAELPQDPHQLTLEQVSRSAEALFDLLIAQSKAEEALQARRHPGQQRHPRFPGIDKLSGKPLPPLVLPKARDVRQAPSEFFPSRWRPGAEQAKLATLGSPSAADLEETLEVTFTDELTALAAALDHDPLRIYNYVANEIDYRIYAGSAYGAQGTLEAGMGNDVDQASLLIALLRLSGIPSRYETGVVLIPRSRVPEMFGIEDVPTASSALWTMGVKSSVVYEGNVVTYLKMERTWVRAFLPYTNYRGANQGAAGINTWVALDPAVKKYSIVRKLDVSGQVDFDVDAFLSAPTSTSAFSFYEDAIRDHLRSEGKTCETLEQAKARLVLQPYDLEILPSSLPFDTVSTTTTTSALGASMRHQLLFELVDSYGYELMSKTVSLPELYGKVLALTFPSGSGITSSISGNVKPTLSLDGQILFQVSAASAGTAFRVYTAQYGPNSGPTYHEHDVTAGGTYVESFWLGPVPKQRLEAASSELLSLRSSGASQAAIDLRIAQLAGLTFHSRHQSEDDEIYALEGWLQFTEYEALAGTNTTTSYFFGLPRGAVAAGYLIDAENLVYAAPLRGARSSAVQARLSEIAGYNGSFNEHRVWEDVISLMGLSSTNVLQLARAEGQTIFFLTSMNDYNAVASRIAHSYEVESDVTEALNAGQEVVISERPVSKGDKLVSGYVLYDPNSGAGRYLIETGENGGVTVDFMDLIAEIAGGLWTFSIFSRVEVPTGNLKDDVTLASITANGRPTLLEAHFLGQSDLPTELGPGWQWTYGDRLFEDSSAGKVSYVSGAGQLYVFTRQSDGTYLPPPGQGDTLVKSSSGWTLTHTTRTTKTFDAPGRLTQVRDEFGNMLTLVRGSDGRLSEIRDSNDKAVLAVTTDASGHILTLDDRSERAISFGYNNGRLTEVTDPTDQVWAFSYDGQGHLIGSLEPDGESYRHTYDGDGHLSAYATPFMGEGYVAYDTANGQTLWTNAEGEDRLYVWNEDGQVVETVDALGNQKTYEYRNGRIVRTVNARGGVSTFTYNAQGLMTQQVDPEGNTVSQTYDAKNRLTRRSSPDGVSTFTFDDQARTLTLVNEDGDTEVRAFNAQGLVTQSTDAEGNTLEVTYSADLAITGLTVEEAGTTQITMDPVGRVTALTSPEGRETTLSYGEGDQPTSVTGPDGEVVQLTYTAAKEVASILEPSGDLTTYSYQGEQLASETDPQGRTTRYEFDRDGRQVAVVDSMGNREERVLDAEGNVLSVTDARGNKTEMNYCADLAGTPCDIIDPLGNLIQRTFDGRGRILTETSGLGTTQYEYDDVGLSAPSAVVDPLGHRTEFKRTTRGALLMVLDALGQVTDYTVDANGKVTSVTDATGSRTTYTRDARGHVTQIMDALGRLTFFEYDTQGRPVEKMDANGRATQYAYSPDGELTEERFDDLTGNFFEYDRYGNVVRSTNDQSDQEYAYTYPEGKLSSFVDHSVGVELTYSYDVTTGKCNSLTRPDGVQTYTYNRFGDVISISLPDGQRIFLDYDSLGRLSQKRFPNGTRQSAAYDAYGRLSSLLSYNKSGDLIAGVSYTYDALNRRTSVTTADGRKTTYAYDARGQLQSETRDGSTLSYAYDGAGNRLSISLNGVVTKRYTYDDAHQLQSIVEGSKTLTLDYDDNGNVVAKHEGSSTTTYSYDGANQLIRIVLPGGITERFGYDARGRRVYRADAEGEVFTVYDQEDALLELDADGNLLRGFVQGPGIDAPLALLDYAETGKTYFYHTDGIGSVLALSASDGRVVNAYRYSSFGELEVVGEEVSNRVTYAGRPVDPATGSYDFRARQLEPSIGRFLQPDPRTLDSFERVRTSLAAGLSALYGLGLGDMLEAPGTLHPYGYVANNPLNFTDPSGEAVDPWITKTMQVLNLCAAIFQFMLAIAIKTRLWSLCGVLFMIYFVIMFALFIIDVYTIVNAANEADWDALRAAFISFLFHLIGVRGTGGIYANFKAAGDVGVLGGPTYRDVTVNAVLAIAGYVWAVIVWIDPQMAAKLWGWVKPVLYGN